MQDNPTTESVMPFPSPYMVGMLVGTSAGVVGILTGRYLYRSRSVPAADHWRAVLKTHDGRVEVREDKIAGRVSYERAPLRVLRGGLQ